MTSQEFELTPELKAKLDACTSPEELAALANAEDVDLSDDMLEAASGGKEQGYCYGFTYKNFYCEKFGDEREDVDPSLVPVAFMEGALDASVYF